MMSLSEDDLELQPLALLPVLLLTLLEPPDYEDQAQAEATHQQHTEAENYRNYRQALVQVQVQAPVPTGPQVE